MSCDLTGVGRLERNINLSDSFLGVITVKLKNKTKNVLHFQQVSWTFHAFPEFIFSLYKRTKRNKVNGVSK